MHPLTNKAQKAEFAFKHFEGDTNLSFALLEEDPVTKRPVRRLISNPTVKKDFAGLLGGQSSDRRKLAQLIDLLERMMQVGAQLGDVGCRPGMLAAAGVHLRECTPQVQQRGWPAENVCGALLAC